MHAVCVARDRPPHFPDACVVCGRPSPSGVTRVKAAYTKRVAGVVNVIAGEWGADVPTCEPCGQRVRSQHRGRFLFALLWVVVGTVAAAVVVPDGLGWWQNPARVAVLLSCMLPYWVFEGLNRRPVSLTVSGSVATFSFRDTEYAAEFGRLNGVSV